MRRQVGLADVIQDVRGAPADERIDLDALALGFEQRRLPARRALKALAPGDPGLIPFQRLGQRQNLADFAAAVGVAGEEKAFRVFGRERRGVRFGDDDVFQA